MRPTVVILAAGLGTRMRSSLPKVLHDLAGKPMIRHVLDTVSGIQPETIATVLGYQADEIRRSIEDYQPEIVIQEQQLGTGHAVRQAAKVIERATGPILVLCGDTPLLKKETLAAVIEKHRTARSAVTLLTAKVGDPTGYGRIVRGKSGVMKIVEEKDASSAQKKIREVNTGIYCFDKTFLLSALHSIDNKNAQGEYYLPDVIGLARKKRRVVTAVVCQDADEVMGINSRFDLCRAERIVRDQRNRDWMLRGVTMTDPETVFIGDGVVIGKDTLLYAGVRLEGNTVIGEGCTLLPGSRIVNSTLGDRVVIKDHCVIEQSTVSRESSVGPFAHLRPGTVLGEGAKVGNFVEIKKSVIGERSKANHLSYIGDATVGRDVNIGAGVITCNYDGYQKHQTVIEDGVFVGSDAQLVAPVTIGKGALVAAG
ncbi:MAG: bifunctional UDP-N-acetylglucosamine diphosphorylase/glucosamine-1-phosphate N-acetyltransferase GlmU, partial [Nitrospirota bacterium]|nr:bifunctional UDP-N-acetylglucosamine diphosphorylase/glucosamine-1-phosphate N-acetyltransferase GlmU [Nitrospirota bacterium]